MAVEDSLFEDVADALRQMAPDTFGEFRHRSHRYGIKVWFGPATPPKEHYEAQVIGPGEVKGAKVLAIEVGFHSEHPKVAENDEVIAHLTALVGAKVRVTLEIGADIPSGAPDQVVRTVTENSRTLKFTCQGFEKE